MAMFPAHARDGSEWQRAACAVALACASGCGSQVAPVKPAVPKISLGVVRAGAGGGPDVAAIPRPSGSLARVSLWIDAGARDAEPPQVATLAAWLAAEAAGPAVESQVWPDAIELSLSCQRNELEACVARLARGVGWRKVAPTRLAALSARLVAARRDAEAADPRRSADRLALEALFGAGARAFVPLGRADDDAAIRPSLVEEFAARHFGLGRLLLLGTGALDTDALMRAAQKPFARTPRASQPRAQRARGLRAEGGVAVGIENKPGLSLAIAASDLSQAHAAAGAVERSLLHAALASSVKGQAFLVRGAALALLRVETREPFAVVRVAAHELERVRREGATPVAALPSAEDLAALARRLGMRWAAGEGPQLVPLALGVGLVASGGRGDRAARKDDPDAALQKSVLERAEAAWKEGVVRGDPRTSGASDDRAASVTLDNGAHIELRQRASENVAIAVRFGRTGPEPPSLHGRAALLATLTSTACAGLAPGALVTRVEELGARLEARADAESWGLLLTAPGASWQTALALMLDCALHPALDRATLAAARLALRERLGPQLGALDLRARAAELVAPETPSEIAPWGSPARQAGIGLPALRELWADTERGPAVAVAVVGPLPVQDALGWVARRLSELGPRSSANPDASARIPPAAVGPEARQVSQPTFGLAVWQTRAEAGGGAGALAFAALMRAALGRSFGVTASWHDAGESGSHAWAAVTLAGATESLTATAAQLRSLAHELAQANLEHAADQACELAERDQAAEAADPATEAETLARSAVSTPPLAPDCRAARALALRLASAEPVFIPLR